MTEETISLNIARTSKTDKSNDDDDSQSDICVNENTM